MKQDFQGFLSCSAAVHYGDIADDQACMAKFGYDPASRSSPAALRTDSGSTLPCPEQFSLAQR
jgi:hypothetical protein